MSIGNVIRHPAFGIATGTLFATVGISTIADSKSSKVGEIAGAGIVGLGLAGIGGGIMAARFGPRYFRNLGSLSSGAQLTHRALTGLSIAGAAAMLGAPIVSGIIQSDN